MGRGQIVLIRRAVPLPPIIWSMFIMRQTTFPRIHAPDYDGTIFSNFISLWPVGRMHGTQPLVLPAAPVTLM